MISRWAKLRYLLLCCGVNNHCSQAVEDNRLVCIAATPVHCRPQLKTSAVPGRPHGRVSTVAPGSTQHSASAFRRVTVLSAQMRAAWLHQRSQQTTRLSKRVAAIEGAPQKRSICTMREVSYFVAASLDGYIARTDGTVEWLFTDQVQSGMQQLRPLAPGFAHRAAAASLLRVCPLVGFRVL